MKKVAKILSLSLVALVFFGYVGLIFVFGAADWYSSNHSRWKTVAYGPSMYPTIQSGQEFELDSYLAPEVNDIISFSCFQRCIEGDTAPNGEKILTKRLLKINGSCYWVEGDNKSDSYDSREFGWICKGDDIRLNGVVTAIGDNVFHQPLSFPRALIGVIKNTF